jgi:hypothetical protein
MFVRRLQLSGLVLAAACAGHEPAADSARLDVSAAPAPPAASVPADSAGTGAPRTRWVVTPRGIGPVVAGMPLASLSAAMNEQVKPAYDAGSSCAYVRPAALPHDVLVMLQHDTVARVDVRGKGVLTDEGAGVGDSEASVLQRYQGRVRTMPHKYTGPQGHYLIVSALRDTMHLIVFETDGKVVTNYRAGRRPAVELVEGCS